MRLTDLYQYTEKYWFDILFSSSLAIQRVDNFPYMYRSFTDLQGDLITC